MANVVGNNPSITINGGRRLTGGRVQIDGSSNQVTKAIIASLLTDDTVMIKGAPDVDECHNVANLFKMLGGRASFVDENTLELNAKQVDKNSIPKEICMQNRISILCVGPLLHRFKEVRLYAALGGDQIGKRPVNFHVQGLEQMGAQVELEDNYYVFRVGDEGLQGAHITLSFPSVMTTENLMIAATKAKGRTTISNAAIEPEVFELAKMLQKMGADIKFAPNRTIVIQGVSELHGCEIRCMLDRNQAVSFALSALCTGGDVLLSNVRHESVFSFLNFIQRMGATFKINSEGLWLYAPSNNGFKGAHIEVEVHPGFMTDWQQPFMVLFTQSQGVSIIHETVFENRLGYTEFLNKMGANITLTSACLGEVDCRFKERNFVHSAIIQGPTTLQGCEMTLPTDIRAGKCLVIAGLVAEGKTTLHNIRELDRKFGNITKKLEGIGADVTLH